MSWTDERVDELKNLWAEGVSASQIAVRMGGISRSAVLGKVHRLGLSGRSTSSKKIKRKSKTPKKTSISLVPKSPELPKDVLYQSLRNRPIPDDIVSLQELTEGQCRFIYGDLDSDKWGYCGKPTAPGRSYCKSCYQVVTHRGSR